jgi:hypothetical protein
MLCSLCQRLSWQQIFSSTEPVNHHETYADLSLSASHGCQFCNVAHVAVLDTHSKELSLPIEDVVQLHLGQDRLEDQRNDKEHSGFSLTSVKIDLDTRFAPFSEGVIGITYGRDMIEGVPIGQIYPYISLSAVEGM